MCAAYTEIHIGVCRMHRNAQRRVAYKQRCVTHKHKCTKVFAALKEMYKGVCRIHRSAQWYVPHTQKCSTVCDAYTEMHNCSEPSLAVARVLSRGHYVKCLLS